MEHLTKLATLTCMVLLSLLISAEDPSRQVIFNIVEEVDPQELIGNVADSAELLKQYGNEVMQKLQFSILSDDREENFRITPETGELWTAKRIDRDELCPSQVKCAMSLDVMVQPAQYITIIKVTVIIEDVNDNDPTFPQVCKNIPIPESSTPGATFSLPIAEDKDSPKYGITVGSYRLLGASDLFHLKITPGDTEMTLKLILNNKLDRERGDQYGFQLVATDGGTPERTGTLLINITVSDINDNSPKFNSSLYTKTMAEDTREGSIVAQVFALDPDAGANGEITYGFDIRTNEIKQDLFRIDSVTGQIFLKKQLDYEKEKTHILTVEARDKGSTPLTETTKVKIQVTDVNDHAPQIKLHTLNPPSNIAIISENDQIGFLAHVAVTDPDGGRNGEFYCTLEDNHFVMRHMGQAGEGEYEILSKNLLDREQRNSYNLTIQCQDFGTPSLKSSILVPVKVTDQNDNDPKFVNTPYTASLSENNYIGASVLHVSATDMDEGNNGHITYHIKDDFVNNHNDVRYTEILQIDEETGLISAKSVFDYEQTIRYSFTVIARDRGKKPRTAEAQVSLNVKDTNDEAPKFAMGKYAFGVKENRNPGTSVNKVSASDKDTYPFNEFTYSLDPNSESSDSFRIEPLTGEITTKKVLDREQKSAYNLVVCATDRGNPPLSSSASIIVYIGDTNDNRPIIDFPNRFNNTVEVSSQIPVGFCIVKVRAHDDDSGHNAKLTYTLRRTPKHEFFRIETWSGGIYLAKKLPTFSLGKGQFRLQVEVRDSGDPALETKEDLVVVFDNSIEYIPDHQPAKASLFSARNLLLLTCVAAFALVVIFILLTVLVCLRRKNQGYRPPDKYRVTTGSEYPVYANIRSCETLTRAGSEPFMLTNDSLRRKFDCKSLHDSPIHNHVSTLTSVPIICREDQKEELESLVRPQQPTWPSQHQQDRKEFTTESEFSWHVAPPCIRIDPRPKECESTYDSKHATVDTGYSSPVCTPVSQKPQQFVLKQSDLVPQKPFRGRGGRQAPQGFSEHPGQHPAMFGSTIGSDTSYENAPRGWRPNSGGLDTSDGTYDSNERDELDMRDNSPDTDEPPESVTSGSPRMLSVVSCDV